jgi:hypothetical protein
MGLGDILGTRSDGQGAFTAAQTARDRLGISSAPVSSLPVVDPPDIAQRIQLARAVMPKLGDDPQSLMAIVRGGLPTEQLPTALLQAVNITKQDEQVAFLSTLTKDAQSEAWKALSAEGQQYWRNLGWNGPPSGGGGGFFGTVLGGVGKGLHGIKVGAEAAQDVAAYPYRKAISVPYAGRALEEVTHQTVGRAAAGIGESVHDVVHAVGAAAAVPSHLFRAADYIQQQHGGGWNDALGQVGDLFTPSKLADAWHVTDDGERYIQKPAQEKALTELGGDQALYKMLVDLQAGDAFDEIVARKTGLVPGSQDFADAAQQLYLQINTPQAVRAKRAIAQGKVSVGREVARSIGLDEGSTRFTLVSGGADALWSWYSDPTIMVGKAMKADKVARLSVMGVEEADRAAKLTRFYGQVMTGALDETGAPVLRASGRAADPSFIRANQYIVDAWKAGDAERIVQRFGGQADMLHLMRDWQDAHGAFESVDDVTKFFMAQEMREHIVSGVLLDLHAAVPTLPRITRGNQATEVFKSAVRGYIDLADQEAWLRHGAVISARATNWLGENAPERLSSLNTARAAYANMGARTNALRNIVGATVLSPTAGFMRAALTHVPRGAALDLASERGVREFDRILRMGSYGWLPPELRTAYFDGFVKGTIAEKRQVYIQFLSDLTANLGLKPEKVVQAIPKGQRYSVGAHDILDGLHTALAPITDTSTHIAIPSFRKMLAASTLSSFTARTLAKTAEGLPGYLTSRIWSPLAVLRLAFIPRAVGDEMISYLLRHGPTTYLRGALTPLAYDPAKVYDPAKALGRTFAMGAARVTPAALWDGSAAERAGVWWEHLQHTTQRLLEAPLRHFVGEDRLVGYALAKDDPRKILPALLAENPTVATAFARVGASKAYLEREFNPDINQILQLQTDGWREGSTLAVPINVGNRFESLNRDVVMMDGSLVYAGGANDAALLQSAPIHMNHKLADPVYRAAAEYAGGSITYEDYDRLVQDLGVGRAKNKLPTQIAKTGRQRLDRSADTLMEMSYRDLADFKSALEVGVLPDGRDAMQVLLERWQQEAATKGVTGAYGARAGTKVTTPKWLREREALVREFAKLNPRQRQQVIAWSEHFNHTNEAGEVVRGLRLGSGEFHEEGMLRAVRQALDSPELQPKLTEMDWYKRMTTRIPDGHAQLYTVAATPDDLDELKRVHAIMGDALFATSAGDSPRLAAAMEDLKRGMLDPQLDQLHARLVRDGAGSLPISQWGVIDPTLSYEAMERIRRNAATIPEGAVLADPTVFHLRYHHAPVEDLRPFIDEFAGAVPNLGAARLSKDRRSWLLGNKNLLNGGVYDSASWQTKATLEQAKDRHALAVKNDFRDMFSAHLDPEDAAAATIFHEVLNPGLADGVEVRHVAQMGENVPRVTIRAEPVIKAPNLWSRMVNFGYDRIVSPAIDAMIRQPYFLNEFADAMRDARTLRGYLTDTDLVDRATQRAAALGHDSDRVAAWFDDLPRFDPRRQTVGEWLTAADARVTSRIQHNETLIALHGDEADFGALTATPKRAARMSEAQKARLPRVRETLDAKVADLTELQDALRSWSDDDLKLFATWSGHERQVNEKLVGLASERAVNRMIPYIDDHQVRSQMQELIKPFVPFQFAQEAFYKRYGRTFLYNPEAVGKAALTMGALRDIGFIHKDQFGNDVYVLPGSEQLMDLIHRVAPTVFGYDAMIPVSGALTGSVSYSVPGFDIGNRPFSFSPLVAIPTTALAQRFPEFKPAQEKILGSTYSNQSVTDLIVPAHIRRFYEAATLDEGDKKFANFMVQAMSQLQASGHGLPENATATQREQFTARARNQARILLLTQAVLGVATPASPGVAFEGDLHPEFQALLRSGLSIDDAVTNFIAAHPDATPYTVFTSTVPSKAPFAATHEALNFLLEHGDFVDRYKRAGAWLLPQSTVGDEFHQAAYLQELQHGLRVNKKPDDWVNDMLYAEAAPTYYASKRNYEVRLAGMTDAASKAQLTKSFADWKASYYLLHPVFAEQLTFRGEKAAMDRAEVRRELKLALADPDLPEAGQPQATKLRDILASYDSYVRLRDARAGDQTARADQYRKDLKASFANWGDSAARVDPSVRAFWQRIVRPELGLPDSEE